MWHGKMVEHDQTGVIFHTMIRKHVCIRSVCRMYIRHMWFSYVSFLGAIDTKNICLSAKGTAENLIKHKCH